MTREEAIMHLDYLKDFKTPQQIEAINLAIKSLSVITEQSSEVGEWIPCTKEGLPLTELGRKESQKWYGYKCSKCNFIYKGNALTESSFCQNCGAKMKG